MKGANKERGRDGKRRNGEPKAASGLRLRGGDEVFVGECDVEVHIEHFVP